MLAAGDALDRAPSNHVDAASKDALRAIDDEILVVEKGNVYRIGPRPSAIGRPVDSRDAAHVVLRWVPLLRQRGKKDDAAESERTSRVHRLPERADAVVQGGAPGAACIAGRVQHRRDAVSRRIDCHAANGKSVAARRISVDEVFCVGRSRVRCADLNGFSNRDLCTRYARCDDKQSDGSEHDRERA